MKSMTAATTGGDEDGEEGDYDQSPDNDDGGAETGITSNNAGAAAGGGSGSLIDFFDSSPVSTPHVTPAQVQKPKVTLAPLVKADAGAGVALAGAVHKGSGKELLLELAFTNTTPTSVQNFAVQTGTNQHWNRSRHNRVASEKKDG